MEHTNPSIPGKFFEMPKGMKSAPPQQASLNELWKASAKKAKKEEQLKDVTLVEEDVQMKDVDNVVKSRKSYCYCSFY